jgi:4-diphosphocytidyl-2-C-methyl-D-erythritol kinase
MSPNAPAKLNLFLHVVGRREDGYHLLQSVFTLLDFGDDISVTPRRDGEIIRVSELPGVPMESDLVVRAARLLQQRAGVALGCDIAVIKRTPMGGGLGGGSSDAATVLRLLNRLWALDMPTEALQRLGLTLGADVPFFLFGRPAFAEGVGEALRQVPVPAWWYVVLMPPVHVPTATVFGSRELTRNTIPVKIADFSAAALREWRNDLQPVVLNAFPAVQQYLEALARVSQKSVFGARMTGSGACLFAAFESEGDARDAFQQLTPEYQGFVAKGLLNHPLA